ncbi:MAG TPA: hypothetical protein VHR45_02425 [Thermoanaerobaculia bacterium]|nr:hypothetical protein [Thermoanaerobaculia bacterium]
MTPPMSSDDPSALPPAARAAPAPAAEVSPGLPHPEGAPGEPRVAEVLQRLRSGVRQRRAEAANAGGDLARAGAGLGDALAHQLLAVKSREFVQEPVAFSHRPRFGRLIVWSRKAFFKIFLKWYLRPLLEQQNAFNQAAGRMLQELAEAQERLLRETHQLAALLEELDQQRRSGRP